jgi:hypothetical protein
MVLETGKNHIQKLRAAFNALPHNVSDSHYIRDKLRHMVDVDQYVIELGMDHGAYLDNRSEEQEKLRALIDRVVVEHTDALKGIMATHGWGAIKQMGEHADSYAWLLVQHADHDPAFQAHVLKDMEDSGDVQNSLYAYLYDRVAMNTAQPQRYGTQFTRSSQPYLLEDPDGVDERRRKVGLMSLAEYSAEMVRQQAAMKTPKP